MHKTHVRMVLWLPFHSMLWHLCVDMGGSCSLYDRVRALLLLHTVCVCVYLCLSFRYNILSMRTAEQWHKKMTWERRRSDRMHTKKINTKSQKTTIFMCALTHCNGGPTETGYSLSDTVCLDSSFFFSVQFCFALERCECLCLITTETSNEKRNTVWNFYAYRYTHRNFRRRRCRRPRRLLCVNNSRFGLCATATYYHWNSFYIHSVVCSCWQYTHTHSYTRFHCRVKYCCHRSRRHRRQHTPLPFVAFVIVIAKPERI